MQADGSELAIMPHCMDVLSALAQIPTFREAWVHKAKHAHEHSRKSSALYSIDISPARLCCLPGCGQCM